MILTDSGDSMGFTLTQINDARAKVKTGADFPREIQDFKDIGVKKYEFFVEDGTFMYYGEYKFSLRAPSAYAKSNFSSLEVDAKASLSQFKSILSVHQQGKTDFLTFCKDAAKAGVYKWRLDLEQMTCTYYDTQGAAMLVETVPTLT